MTSKKIRTLFFSRGRGRGHAVPDMALARALQPSNPEIGITFASYGTGATTFRAAQWDVIDGGFPDNPKFFDLLVWCARLIDEHQPDVIISHEEFAALPAARIKGVPALYVSAWLPPANAITAEALACADAILLLADPGVFPPPPGVLSPIYCVGTMVRDFRGCAPRQRTRAQLGIPEDATVWLFAPGSWRESQAPAQSMVLEAFMSFIAKKHLLWIAGADYDASHHANIPSGDMTVFRQVEDMAGIMSASDVVITKSNRNTVFEAASLGIPTISLTYQLNPIDDLFVSRIRSNLVLHARATNSALLLTTIQAILADDVLRNPHPFKPQYTVEQIAGTMGALTRNLCGISADIGTPSPASSPVLETTMI